MLNEATVMLYLIPVVMGMISIAVDTLKGLAKARKAVLK